MKIIEETKTKHEKDKELVEQSIDDWLDDIILN